MTERIGRLRETSTVADCFEVAAVLKTLKQAYTLHVKMLWCMALAYCQRETASKSTEGSFGRAHQLNLADLQSCEIVNRAAGTWTVL
jgi:hypothetical protein